VEAARLRRGDRTSCSTFTASRSFRLTDAEITLVAADTAETERWLQPRSATFDLSDMQLRQRTIDLVTLLQAQQPLLAAQDLLVVDRLSRLSAILGLFQALRGGWLAAVAPTRDL
jgi:hypothetical protein